MMFLPVLLLFLAILFGILGYKEDHDMFKNLAIVLAIAAVGAAIVTLFAFSSL